MGHLSGEYFHKLDVKGRLSLPADIKRELESNRLKMTISPNDDCLYVFEHEAFIKWVAELLDRGEGFKANSLTQSSWRKKLNSRAMPVEIDSYGRFGIPNALRDAVSLDKDVVLIGDEDHFEIWDSRRWNDFSESVDLTALFEE